MAPSAEGSGDCERVCTTARAGRRVRVPPHTWRERESACNNTPPRLLSLYLDFNVRGKFIVSHGCLIVYIPLVSLSLSLSARRRRIFCLRICIVARFCSNTQSDARVPHPFQSACSFGRNEAADQPGESAPWESKGKAAMEIIIYGNVHFKRLLRIIFKISRAIFGKNRVKVSILNKVP